MTRAVAALTDRPILVTKPCIERAGKAFKVLFATDGSDGAEATAVVLAGLPFPEGSELTILNIAWSGVTDIPDRYAMEVNDAMKAELAKIRIAENEKAEKIVDRANERLAGRFAAVHSLIKGGDPTDEVLKAAGEGDALASRLIDDLADYLSIAVVAIASLIDPEVIVIGGYIGTAGESLLQRIRKSAERAVRAMPQLLLSALGDDAVLLGAIALAQQGEFSG